MKLNMVVKRVGLSGSPDYWLLCCQLGRPVFPIIPTSLPLMATLMETNTTTHFLPSEHFKLQITLVFAQNLAKMDPKLVLKAYSKSHLASLLWDNKKSKDSRQILRPSSHLAADITGTHPGQDGFQTQAMDVHDDNGLGLVIVGLVLGSNDSGRFFLHCLFWTTRGNIILSNCFSADFASPLALQIPTLALIFLSLPPIGSKFGREASLVRIRSQRNN